MMFRKDKERIEKLETQLHNVNERLQYIEYQDKSITTEQASGALLGFFTGELAAPLHQLEDIIMDSSSGDVGMIANITFDFECYMWTYKLQLTKDLAISGVPEADVERVDEAVKEEYLELHGKGVYTEVGVPV
jgi:hypothetical protein